MKVLLINGSPNEKGCTYTALSQVAGALRAEGIQADSSTVIRLSTTAAPTT